MSAMSTDLTSSNSPLVVTLVDSSSGLPPPSRSSTKSSVPTQLLANRNLDTNSTDLSLPTLTSQESSTPTKSNPSSRLLERLLLTNVRKTLSPTTMLSSSSTLPLSLSRLKLNKPTRLPRLRDKLLSRLTENLERPSRRALKLGFLPSTMPTPKLLPRLSKKMPISLLKVSKSDKKKKKLLSQNDLSNLGVVVFRVLYL